MEHRFASGPLLARLLLQTRMATNKAMRNGRFGPSFLHDGFRYAPLEGVEAHYGIRITDEQLDLAADGKADRVLRIHDQLEIPHGPAQTQG